MSVSEIPESLRGDKTVTSFIKRSNELLEANVVVSYFCKIYVLEHILKNKLHQTNKEVEAFTVSLLDETEKIKNEADEGLAKVLGDRTLSASVVMNFAYRIANASLQDLQSYTGSNRGRLIEKLRAALNFMDLLSIFARDTESHVDFSRLTKGRMSTAEEFEKMNNQKIRTLKYQLTRVVKDEVQVSSDVMDEELEREFNKLDVGAGASASEEGEGNDLQSPEPSEPAASSTQPPADEESVTPVTDTAADTAASSEAPDTSKNTDGDNSNLWLPEAPSEPVTRDSDINLPGVPKYLPDHDISHINKSASIHVFSPSSPKDADRSLHTHPRASPSVSPPKNTPTHSAHEPLTKKNIDSIISATDRIAQAQKYAKFAISALNYEDIDTAEAQLVQALEQVRSIQK
ncbi:Piso0_005604 [Millerozyma farinosa CBS 7064]|uniref:Piso0_005604 protein n=1 Tax=Pichia sorbitophila (strain ATCC MYA-4447 / BCRC 22081 / CBS 7064 / NBRC 10061 / NRRL Y-12695) TaxID=559304 RepID=G8Y2F1_PICSO|nr:Piso0_005604 [Millerozyma farinosa CBS 7064]